MKIKNAILLLISGSLLAPVSVEAQETVRRTSYGNVTCNYVSYIVTSDGRCVDLSHIGASNASGAQNGMKSRFLNAFAKLNIPVKYEQCEKATTIGAYRSSKNEVILCSGYKDQGDELLIETLAHEGWHVVQDCMTGLKDSELKPVSEGNPALFESMVNGLTVNDLRNLELYDSEHLPFEIEAFAMEKHPEAVLKGLNTCANSVLAKT